MRKRGEGSWSWPQSAGGMPLPSSSVPYAASSLLRPAARPGFRRPTITLPPPTPIPAVCPPIKHQDAGLPLLMSILLTSMTVAAWLALQSLPRFQGMCMLWTRIITYYGFSTSRIGAF